MGLFSLKQKTKGKTEPNCVCAGAHVCVASESKQKEDQ